MNIINSDLWIFGSQTLGGDGGGGLGHRELDFIILDVG